jgi:DNA-directed RNA polymerase specialized sigma24 family protein
MSDQQLPDSFDEEAVRILLIGDSEEIGQGLNLVDRHFRMTMSGWVRSQFPGLSSADLADIWQETLSGLFKRVRQQQFDADQPLLPLLRAIARNQAISRTRRLKTDDQLLAAIAESLRVTEIGDRWSQLDELVRRETLECIRRHIRELPYKQRLVIQSFIGGFPETESMELLRQNVSKITGKEETLASVKRALQEARRKFRELLADAETE